VTESFHRALQPLVRARPEGTWVLDLACGTGVLAEKLTAAGCPVVGVDGSSEMLAVARRRCRDRGDRVRFVRADLARFRVREPCALACASGDVFNHVLSLRGLRSIFRRVLENLEPGGLLVFESLNRFCFEQYWSDRTYLMESDGGDLVMECDWHPRRRVGTVRMVGYVRDGRGRFERFETELVERLWSDRELRGALAAAGFAKIRREPWSPWSDQHLEPALDRNLWTAQKPGKKRARAA
jgi:SAM-dependent methyltransferase